MEELIYSIGEKLKDLRLQQKLTISDVSKRTELTNSLISQIENGKSLPSLKSLIALTTALGTTVGHLFSDDISTDNVVVRGTERKAISTGNGVTLNLLTPNVQNRKVEFLMVEYEAGASSGDLHTHSGEEYGIVLDGRLEVTIRDEHYLLEQGDSIVFSSEYPHKIENAHDDTTRVIWANTPPTL